MMVANKTPDIDLVPLPVDHPRMRPCEFAGWELNFFLIDLREKYALTPCEAAKLINDAQCAILSAGLYTERIRAGDSGDGAVVADCDKAGRGVRF